MRTRSATYLLLRSRRCDLIQAVSQSSMKPTLQPSDVSRRVASAAFILPSDARQKPPATVRPPGDHSDNDPERNSEVARAGGPSRPRPPAHVSSATDVVLFAGAPRQRAFAASDGARPSHSRRAGRTLWGAWCHDAARSASAASAPGLSTLRLLFRASAPKTCPRSRGHIVAAASSNARRLFRLPPTEIQNLKTKSIWLNVRRSFCDFRGRGT